MNAPLKCPLCSSLNVRLYAEKSQADLHECRTCSLIFSLTAAPPLVADPSELDREFQSRFQSYQSRVRETEAMLAGRGRFLNLGGSLGHCGTVAQTRGWDTYVMDISRPSALIAKEKFRLKTFVCSDFQKIPVKNSSFDCVTVYEVLEKVRQPLEFLKEIRRTLQPTGLLHLTTLNASSISAILMRKKWFHLKPQENALYFSPLNLKKALDVTGFEVIALKPLKVSMRLGDILSKVRKYWPQGLTRVESFLKRFRLEDKIISVWTGQMQVWARPKPNGESVCSDAYSLEYANTFQCPDCSKELVLNQRKAACPHCHSAFSYVHGMIDFTDRVSEKMEQEPTEKVEQVG